MKYFTTAPIYGLTNWSDETMQEEFARWDIFRLVDDMVVSGREKIVKPDPAIFQCLLTRFGLQAQESVFMDDNLNNVEAAKALGFSAFRFENAEQARREMQKMGVKI